MKFALLIISFIALTVLGSIRIVANIQFGQNCGGYLKRSANASTIELAQSELSKAIKYIEANNLTSGYTSVVYKTPDEDLEYWYKNLVSANEELSIVSPETSQLERTNILMKLRETLTDNHGSGTSVTCPGGISIFPHNGKVAIVCVLFFIMFSFGFLCVIIDAN